VDANHAHPSLTFIGWTLVYNTINVLQIARLRQELRAVRLVPKSR
jgi:hypothetical protein